MECDGAYQHTHTADIFYLNLVFELRKEGDQSSKNTFDTHWCFKITQHEIQNSCK